MHSDLWHYATLEPHLSGFEACFFCLGVSSGGMKEDEYERLTYGITLAAAEVLYRLDPRMTFIYVSGAGTDSSEHGRIMWASVKGLPCPLHAHQTIRSAVWRARISALLLANSVRHAEGAT